MRAAATMTMGRGRVLRGVRTWLPRRLVVLGLVALTLALVQVWMRNKVRAVAWELSRVQQLQDDLLHRQREAQIQFEMERDPNELRSRAKRELGMIEPRPGQVIDVIGAPRSDPTAGRP